MKMTYDQFRLKITYDLGRYASTEEAKKAMEYGEWLQRFSVFAVRDWVTSKYNDGVLEERDDLRP